MAVIGSITVGMTAVTDKFVAGINKGIKALNKLGDRAAGVIGPVARLSAGFAAGGAAAAGGFALAMADVIDKTGDAADRIGTTTARLSELRYAAQLTGSEGEALDGALSKLNANLGDAATKGGPAADALKKMGLDAAELARMDPTEAFRKISGGFTGIPSDAEKAAAALDIFGKQGMGLLNTLNAGPAALDKLSDEYRKFGGAVSETGRQQVGSMFDSLDRVKAVVGGIGSQLAVQLSPFVQAAAEEFIGLATDGEGMGDKVGRAVEFVAKGVGFAADVVQGLRAGFFLAQTGITVAIGGIVGGIEVLGQGLESLLNLLPGVKVSFSSTLTAFREELDRTIEGQAANLNKVLGEEAWSSKVESAFARITAKSKEMASAVAKSGENAARAGAKFEDMAAKTKAADAAIKKYQDEAKSLYEETRTPLEKYQEKLEKIERALTGGAIDEATASRAMKLAGKDMHQDCKFAGALDVGSREVRSAILAATSGRAEGFQSLEKNTGDTVNVLRAIQRQLGRGQQPAPEYQVP